MKYVLLSALVMLTSFKGSAATPPPPICNSLKYVLKTMQRAENSNTANFVYPQGVIDFYILNRAKELNNHTICPGDDTNPETDISALMAKFDKDPKLKERSLKWDEDMANVKALAKQFQPQNQKDLEEEWNLAHASQMKARTELANWNNCHQIYFGSLDTDVRSKPVLEIQACGQCPNLSTTSDELVNLKIKHRRIFTNQVSKSKFNMYLEYHLIDANGACIYSSFITPSVYNK